MAQDPAFTLPAWIEWGFSGAERSGGSEEGGREARAWSMGVIPVPPAIIPIRAALRTFTPPPCEASCLIENVPRPWYV